LHYDDQVRNTACATLQERVRLFHIFVRVYTLDDCMNNTTKPMPPSIASPSQQVTELDAAIIARLQDHFSDGLVTIVGAGHSMGLGLPSMGDLATALLEHVPLRLSTPDTDWDAIAQKLTDGVNLEVALNDISASASLLTVLVAVTADTIAAAESKTINKIVGEGRQLALAKLIPHLAVSGSATIITTNYDRLVELAVELAGYAVDCAFVGKHFAAFDPDAARKALRSEVVAGGRHLTMRYRPNIAVRKPHGSLDWYARGDELIRCPYPVDLPRLMITPGGTKFLLGYERPFDRHRELANHAIDKAARFLMIGYGFNDPHLQTHLTTRIQAGVPTVILARTLSETARQLSASPTVIAIEREDEGAKIYIDGETSKAETSLWSLDTFVKEVLT
jgi:hypothetical protein